jgi:hypothetical protein
MARNPPEWTLNIGVDEVCQRNRQRTGKTNPDDGHTSYSADCLGRCRLWLDAASGSRCTRQPDAQYARRVLSERKQTG